MELRDYVVQYQNGKPDAFDEIFIRSKDDFYRYACMVAGKDEELINDAIQDTYIQIINSISSLDDPDKFIPWGKTILRNKIYAFYRKNGKEITVTKDDDEEGADFFDRMEDDDESLMPGNELDREEVRAIIREVVRELPEKQRVVVCLYYLDEMSVADIATYLQISEGTVKSRLFKAREAIRAKIEAYEKKYDVRLHVLALPFALLHKSLANLPKDFQMSSAASHAVYRGCQSALSKAAEAITGASALGAGAASAGAAGRAAEGIESRAVGGASHAVRGGSGSSTPDLADRMVRNSAMEQRQQAIHASRAARNAAGQNAGHGAGQSAGQSAAQGAQSAGRHTGRAAAKGAVKDAAGTAGKTVGKSAAAAAGKAAGSGAAKKIVAGVIAAALVAGGGFGGYTFYAAHHKTPIKNAIERKVSKNSGTETLDVKSNLSKAEIMGSYSDVLTPLYTKMASAESNYEMSSDDAGTDYDLSSIDAPYIARDFDGDGTPDMIVFSAKNYSTDSSGATTYIVVRTPDNVQVITDIHQGTVNDPWVVTATKDLKTIRIAYMAEDSSGDGYYGGTEYKYSKSNNDHKTMIYQAASSSSSSDEPSEVKRKYVSPSHAFRVTDLSGDEDSKGEKTYTYTSELKNLLMLSGVNIKKDVDADNWKDAYLKFFTEGDFPLAGVETGDPETNDIDVDPDETIKQIDQNGEFDLLAKDINNDGVPEIFFRDQEGTVNGNNIYMVTYLNGRIVGTPTLVADGKMYVNNNGYIIADGTYTLAEQVTTANAPVGAYELQLTSSGMKLVKAAAKSYTPDSTDDGSTENTAKGMLNFEENSGGNQAYSQMESKAKSGSFQELSGWTRIHSEAEAKSFIEKLCK